MEDYEAAAISSLPTDSTTEAKEWGEFLEKVAAAMKEYYDELEFHSVAPLKTPEAEKAVAISSLLTDSTTTAEEQSKPEIIEITSASMQTGSLKGKSVAVEDEDMDPEEYDDELRLNSVPLVKQPFKNRQDYSADSARGICLEYPPKGRADSRLGGGSYLLDYGAAYSKFQVMSDASTAAVNDAYGMDGIGGIPGETKKEGLLYLSRENKGPDSDPRSLRSESFRRRLRHVVGPEPQQPASPEPQQPASALCDIGLEPQQLPHSIRTGPGPLQSSSLSNRVDQGSLLPSFYTQVERESQQPVPEGTGLNMLLIGPLTAIILTALVDISLQYSVANLQPSLPFILVALVLVLTLGLLLLAIFINNERPRESKVLQRAAFISAAVTICYITTIPLPFPFKWVTWSIFLSFLIILLICKYLYMAA